jgi:hypothetical protein
MRDSLKRRSRPIPAHIGETEENNGKSQLRQQVKNEGSKRVAPKQSPKLYYIRVICFS